MYRFPEIVSRYHDALEIRQSEIDRVAVGFSNGLYDISELWLTSYGYSILSVIHHRKRLFLPEIDEIVAAFDELGYQIRIKEKAESGVRMSEELKRCIWWIVRYEGHEPWNLDVDQFHSASFDIDALRSRPKSS